MIDTITLIIGIIGALISFAGVGFMIAVNEYETEFHGIFKFANNPHKVVMLGVWIITIAMAFSICAGIIAVETHGIIAF